MHALPKDKFIMRLSFKSSPCLILSSVFSPASYARSPPRPSPGSLHYSDEDVSAKYNDLIAAESSSLTEKPSEISDSQVSADQNPLCFQQRTYLSRKPRHTSRQTIDSLSSEKNARYRRGQQDTAPRWPRREEQKKSIRLEPFSTLTFSDEILKT